MDDEELGYASLQEILYRVDTGNYEYRFVEHEIECTIVVTQRSKLRH